MISRSPDVAYLREPVNQMYLGGITKETVVDPDSNEALRRRYTRLADRAFEGALPWRMEDFTERIDAFALGRRNEKTLLIKEVNPLAAGFYVRRYRPKLVVILRHPAAVAESYRRMGWLGGEFEELGHRYGVHMAAALAADESAASVRFEDLALNPRARFRALFAMLGLRLPERFGDVVAELCEASSEGHAAYELRRSSRYEAHKWKERLNRAEISAVMAGYLRSPLTHYPDE